MSYRRVDDAFWGGELALAISGNTAAIAAAFYLLTGPEAARSSIGVFRLSSNGLAEVLGISSRTTSEVLRILSETGFCVVDEKYRMIFVVEAGRHEYGESPNPLNNRVKALVKALPGLLATCPKSFVWKHFWDRYGEPWEEVLEVVSKSSRSRLEVVSKSSGTGSASCRTLEARFEKLDPRVKSAVEDADASQPQVKIPDEIEAIGDLLTRAERVRFAEILQGPKVRPSEMRTEKQNDEKGMRAERLYLLAHLEHLTADAVKRDADGNAREDTALELWRSWRARARAAGVHNGSANWESDVKALRALLGAKKTGRQVLTAMAEASTPGWRKFDWSYVDKPEKGNGSGPPKIKGSDLQAAKRRRDAEQDELNAIDRAKEEKIRLEREGASR